MRLDTVLFLNDFWKPSISVYEPNGVISLSIMLDRLRPAAPGQRAALPRIEYEVFLRQSTGAMPRVGK